MPWEKINQYGVPEDIKEPYPAARDILDDDFLEDGETSGNVGNDNAKREAAEAAWKKRTDYGQASGQDMSDSRRRFEERKKIHSDLDLPASSGEVDKDFSDKFKEKV